MSRHRTPQLNERLDALFACPLIHDLAYDLGELGRKPRRHPVAMHLAFGAMARLWHSGNRADAELAHPDAWAAVVDRYNRGAHAHPHGEPLTMTSIPLIADTHLHVREHLSTDENLTTLSEAFTRHSVDIAHTVGLLDPNGPRSRARPHPSRTIYGDGTVVRPLYGARQIE